MARCDLDLELDDVLHEIHECIQQNISPSVFDANGEGRTAALTAAFSLALEHSTVAALVPLVAQYQQYERLAPAGLLLSDLGALLPDDTRQQVKAQLGGLRAVLLRHPQVFQLSGEPGKEVVQLVGERGAKSKATVRRASRESVGSGLPTPRRRLSPRRGARSRRSSRETDATMTPQLTPMRAEPSLFRRTSANRRSSREPEQVPTLKLRGLPFACTEDDVRAFALYQGVKVLPEQVSLVRTRDGRSTGFATIQFDELLSATRAQQLLHMRVVEDRYVEVFLKMQQGKQESPGTSTRASDNSSSFGDSSAEGGVNEEHAVEELEAFLAHHPQGVLLSMLGIAAGDATRAWMREHGLGLKQLLARHTDKFAVEGEKGKQAVRLAQAEWTAEPQLPALPFPDLSELPPLPLVPPQLCAPLWPLLFPLMPLDLDLVAAVRLRGLPFAATEEDVWQWLLQPDVDAQQWCGPHGVQQIEVLRRKNGRATGQAVVRFACGIPRAEVEKLHKRSMGDRYIEVLDENHPA